MLGNSVAADALASFAVRVSSVIVLLTRLHVFREDGFHLTVPFQCRELIENETKFGVFKVNVIADHNDLCIFNTVFSRGLFLAFPVQ